MRKSQVTEIFTIFSAKFKDPQTELEFINLYTLLVSVILSAQSTDKGVNKATKDLYKIVHDPEAMLELGEEGLKRYIKTIGLYNSKAKNIIKASKALVEKHQSVIPDNFKELRALPGVGQKTANVVLNVGFKRPTMPVDTHVFRVSNRIGLTKEKTPEKVEEKLLKIIAKPFLLHAHHQLILHGRYTCKARNPLCSVCEIKHICKFKQKNF